MPGSSREGTSEAAAAGALGLRLSTTSLSTAGGPSSRASSPGAQRAGGAPRGRQDGLIILHEGPRPTRGRGGAEVPGPAAAAALARMREAQARLLALAAPAQPGAPSVGRVSGPPERAPLPPRPLEGSAVHELVCELLHAHLAKYEALVARNQETLAHNVRALATQLSALRAACEGRRTAGRRAAEQARTAQPALLAAMRRLGAQRQELLLGVRQLQRLLPVCGVPCGGPALHISPATYPRLHAALDSPQSNLDDSTRRDGGSDDDDEDDGEAG
jgi:hypothetical protein